MRISETITNSLKRRAQTKRLESYLRNHVRHYKPSYIYSPDEREGAAPNLLKLALEAIQKASETDLKVLAGSFAADTAGFITAWPGEHYRLLAGIASVVKPRLAIEIGTATGASALCVKKQLLPGCRLISYDIVPWDEYPQTGLRKTDFDGQLEQRVMDLTRPETAAGQRETFKAADLIFIDAAKDGRMEQVFCDYLDSVKFDRPPLVVFDDIKFYEMIDVWHGIRHPKIDLTSFGHWSGTGLVSWE